MTTIDKKKILILGGGFAGVWAAMAAATQREQQQNSDIEITLVSSQAALCIKPRLYEKPDPSMLVPLQPLLDEIGVNLVVDVVKQLNPNKTVDCANNKLEYDKLIFALGSQISSSKISGAKNNTFNIDSYQSSKNLEQHLTQLIATQSHAINIAVIGSGFTGIELVLKLQQRFQEKVRLTLIERGDKIAASLGESMQPSISDALKQGDIQMLTNHSIDCINKDCIDFTNGTSIPADAIVLATGPQANPLTSMICTNLDGHNRVEVNDNLLPANQQDIFVVGDCAKAKVDDEHYSLMSCQHAMPMGLTAGINAVNALLVIPLRKYRQEFYATCLDLGASGALFSQGWQREIVKTGEEGAAMKMQINQQWIYPPKATIGKQEIFNFILAQLNQ